MLADRSGWVGIQTSAMEFSRVGSAIFVIWRVANVYIKLGGLGMRISGFQFHHRELTALEDFWPMPGGCMLQYLHRGFRHGCGDACLKATSP